MSALVEYEACNTPTIRTLIKLLDRLRTIQRERAADDVELGANLTEAIDMVASAIVEEVRAQEAKPSEAKT